MKLLAILTLLFSTATFSNSKSICGQDDRVPSTEPQVGRALGFSESSLNFRVCTVTMISSSCAISAGHCGNLPSIAQFNNPPSKNGGIQHPPKEDIYEIDTARKTVVDEGEGLDWAVMKIKPNKTTGLLPGDAQGFYQVTFDKVLVGDEIRITGFGRDREDPKRNFAQQTHNGRVVSFNTYKKSAMYHDIDTEAGSSGSSIINLRNGKIIAIHTHSGCERRGGRNASTMISETPKFIIAIKACLATEK